MRPYKKIMAEQFKIDFNKIPSPLAGEGKGEGYLTNDERQVLSLLKYGRENAIGVKALANTTRLPDVEIRAIIRHLIMEHNFLIASAVSAPAGFYIAETVKEIEQATKSLRHRGIMILMRAAKLQKISLEEIFHQSRIEFEEVK